MTLTHGLRAKYLPEFAWLAEQGVRLHPLDAEVLRWRIVIKRATILWQYIETLEEACLLLKVIGQAGVNLARAIKRRKQIGALARELDLVEELLEGWV